MMGSSGAPTQACTMTRQPVERDDAGRILDLARVRLPDRFISRDDMDPDILFLVGDSMQAVRRLRIDLSQKDGDDLGAAADAGHELADAAKLADDIAAGLLPRLAPGDLGQFLARLDNARRGFQAPG